MTSIEPGVCPSCAFRWNPPGATVCQTCGAALPQAAVVAGNPEPPTPPRSASPYPPPPPPPTPVAGPPAPITASPALATPSAAALFGGTIAGTVRHFEQTVGRMPSDPARWLILLSILIGLLPLVTVRLVPVPGPLLDGIVVAALVLVTLSLVLTGRRTQQLLSVSLEAAGQEPIKVLMVNPTGRPAVGDTIEVYGRTLPRGRFYATRLRVLATGASVSKQSPLAGGVTYIGKSRASYWTPLVILVFVSMFWLILYYELQHLPLLR